MGIKNVTIENTTFCGANCKMCIRDKMKYELSTMPMDLFKKVLNEIDELNKDLGEKLETIDYGGMGDPLLDIHLLDRAQYVSEKYPNVRQSITSTCDALGNQWDVLKYIDTLKISNYGFSKKSFESIHRGKLSYERTRGNIDKLLSSERTVKVIMSFLVFEENEDEIEQWLNYYRDKCDEIYVWRPHNWAGQSESHTVLDRDAARSCKRVGKDFVIRANGEVSVCCFDGLRQMSVGKLPEASLRDIYYGEKLKKVKECHDRGEFCKLSICKNCDQLYDRSDALLYSSNKEYKVGSSLTSKAKYEEL